MDPYAETHWCRRCETFRTKTAGGLCPVCLDTDRLAERAAVKPVPPQ
jgi:RNA polymerase subunit RPABC4/transcription elongation factor Spt4